MFLNLQEADGQKKYKCLVKKMKDKFFLTSRHTNDIYQFIVDACVKDSQKKKNYKNLKIKEIKILKKFNYKFIFYVLFLFFKGKFFSRREITKLKYNNINFGLYITSWSARSFATYQSSFKFFFEIFRSIIRTSYYIETANYYLKKYRFSEVYIDHAMYLNGIFFDIFFRNKKTIYSNNHPHSLFKIIPKSNKESNFLNYLKIKYVDKKLTQKEKLITKKKIKKLFLNPKKYIAYMEDIKFQKIDKKIDKKLLKNYEYIIYAHSVTDAQLICGVDGFSSTLDWQIFTINHLIRNNKKFIVKAHPAFYLKGKVFSWEKKIFLKLMKRYKEYKDVLFIEKPFENFELIKNLDPKCIILTHHGTAELEMVYHNFKVISFKNNIYNHKYNISNKWTNPNEYESLLNKNWSELKFANYNNFLKLMNKFYVNGAYYGNDFYLQTLQKYMIRLKIIKNSKKNIENTIKVFSKIKNKKKILKNINVKIEVF